MDLYLCWIFFWTVTISPVISFSCPNHTINKALQDNIHSDVDIFQDSDTDKASAINESKVIYKTALNHLCQRTELSLQK